MKVTINGNVSKEVLKSILNNQSDKVKIIDEFCKENKLNSFYYHDNELDYEFAKLPNKKVEVRNNE